MADIDLWWKSTQAQLQPHVPGVSLQEKYLRRPPFRFIHDICAALHKQYQCFPSVPDGGWSARNVDTKEAKLGFLDFVLKAVEAGLGRNVDVTLQKVVSGTEVEQTNAFLRAIAAFTVAWSGGGGRCPPVAPPPPGLLGTAPAVKAQIDRFYRSSSTTAAFEHSIPHEVVSQVLRPGAAAFMPPNRVVLRDHNDERCCVETAMLIAQDYSLGLDDIEYLTTFPQLTRLIVKDRAMDTATLAVVATKLPRLQYLDLSHCRGVDAAGLAEVAKLTQLQRLDLYRCQGIDAAGLGEVAKLTQLRHLELGSAFGEAAGLTKVD